MKYIAEDGLSTRNVPASTMDSIELSAKCLYLAGIKLDTYLTTDNNLVIVKSDVKLPSSFGPISNCSYELLKKYNIGTKVKSHYINTLNQVLEVYQDNKQIIILNLIDESKNKERYIEVLKQIINNHPTDNIYVLSSNKKMLDLLKKDSINAKIGLKMTNNNVEEWSEDYDFYVIDTNTVPVDFIKDRLLNKKEVMTNLIQNKDELTEYFKIYTANIIDDMYIITLHPKIIKDYYNNLTENNL
ncbi:MAG: hypothetical protein GX861_02690 [Tenericutes bacterium]|jgi:glycerophosphoryl diester phosphodiesterase|nr:hypothetical protein [Mycoplasmatota bacterium]